MSKVVKTNVTLMLANDVTLRNLSDVIEEFDESKIIYPENYNTYLDNASCVIYRRQGNYKKPDWAEKLRKTTGIDIANKLLDTLSQGASVLIPVTRNNKNYMFILNYATGHFSIKKSVINKYFGIYIAHKELVDGRASIKRGKSREISSNPINKDRMFGASVDDENFNIMLKDNEVIREVTAYAKDKKQFYHGMVGSYSSLNVTLNYILDDEDENISLEQLKGSLCQLIDIYDSVTEEDKKKLFKGLSPVEMTNDMKDIISEKLSNNLSDFFFFEPDTDINLAQIDHFKIGDVESADFDIATYAKGQKLTYQKLESENVIILDDDGRELKKWNLLDCLYGEFEANGSVYFISHGELFDINRDKYNDIKANIAMVEDKTVLLSSVGVDRANKNIQNYIALGTKKVRREYCYNKEVSSELSAELFDNADKHIVVYDTQIEVCDVFIPQQKVFIHSKIRRGPDSLSHLFAQGLVSADTYAQIPERFVEAVNSKILDCTKHINENWRGSTVKYIILTSSNVEKRLPFFAQMQLNNVINDLRSKNFKVQLSWEDRINIK